MKKIYIFRVSFNLFNDNKQQIICKLAIHFYEFEKKNYTQHQTHANIREIKLDCLNEWMEIKETSLL